MSIQSIWRLLKETVAEWQEDQAPLRAAALAFYTTFSLAPLSIIVIAVAGAIFGEKATVRGRWVTQIQSVVGRDAAQLIQTAIANASQLDPDRGTIATLINIGILLFGATVVFAQLQQSLNQIWEVKPKPTNHISLFLRKRLLSFSMVLAIAFLLLVSLVISALLVIVSDYLSNFIPGFTYISQLLNFLASFCLETLLFATIYKVLPDVKITWSNVWIGAAITAALFEIGKLLLGFYLGKTGLGSVYGAAGSLVITLTWVFYAVQILFLGAEFTKVYARKYGKKIVPAQHAIRDRKTNEEEESER